jgi:hypothetical protein
MALLPGTAMAQADTAQGGDTVVARIQPGKHQLTLYVDLVNPIINLMGDSRNGYEFSADYFWKNELYFVAEGGFGSSKANYDNLKYEASSSFLRLGFNKVLLPRDRPDDWSGMLLGLRLGAAAISRTTAAYVVTDTVWGSTSGTVGGKNFGGYWMEVTGGMRVELVKGLMAGWNVRGKFLLNTADFRDLAPLYVAGYGRGEKNAVFDFNLYLGYAIRWRKK